MWLLECHKIHFKYSKLFWSLWSFFAFEKRRLSFLFRRITSIKLPKCFTLERLNPRNACSDTHACHTFISAPAYLCNISVHIPYSSSSFLVLFQVCKFGTWFRVYGTLGVCWLRKKMNPSVCFPATMWNLQIAHLAHWDPWRVSHTYQYIVLYRK